MLIAVAMLLVSSAAFGVDVTVPEARLKAAIISKFPQFIEWPDSAVDGRRALSFCVAGPGALGQELRDVVAGQSLNGLRLDVRVVATPSQLADCHVLFLPSRPGSPHPLLAPALTRPILTVSDDPRFLDQGGMVALRVIDGRVRFEINDAAARRVGLRISSQLLQLAVGVRGGTS